MSPGPPDVSVILNAHAEGRLAHRSVRSALRAISYARQQGISAELIAVLDDPSPATIEYFRSQAIQFGEIAEIAEVRHRDLGLARNDGVARARGRYVAFLDADDLFSENWLAAACRFAAGQGQDRLVLHPELNLYFGDGLAAFRHKDTTEPDYSPLNFIRFNHWTALSFVARDFFLAGNQYAPSDLHGGFGYEDWHWNCETIARGAVHRVVPRTVHFLRLKPSGSLARTTSQAHATIRPTSLFAEGSAVLSTRMARPARPRVLRRLLSRMVDLERYARPRPPDWLLAEWRGIHLIEPELFPDASLLGRLHWQSYPDASAVRCYPTLHRQIGPDPTHVFLTARWNRGPAARHLLDGSRSLLAQGHRVAWIVTESRGSFAWGLPPGIRLVESGRLLSAYDDDQKILLLLRLLLQKQPREIHNMDCALGHLLFSRHGPALSSRSRLYVSLYRQGCSLEGRRCGPAFTHLPAYVDSVTGVAVHVPGLVDTLCATYAFERHKFS